MIPELGHFALVMALCVALVQAVLPLAGAARGVGTWMAVARPAARAQFFFLLLAILCLGYAFVQNDFSVLYVAAHSNTSLPVIYRIAAIWGGHEGSMLLWIFILGLWTTAVTFFSRSLPDAFVARVLGVLGLVSSGFLLFILFTSNPFERLVPAAVNGADLNPLLQDPVMAVHPPMLYMGYVGFSVAFAFAVASLIGGRLDATWARWSRPWTLAAWCFLSAGIALGSWWAYYELGWGGWWFWDPVENASFMPWLVGTALIHSLAVVERRGGFKRWAALLAITAFSLSLLGTFLVRSGVLTSVHAFATDPKRGVFILVFLAIVVGSSLLLYAWRAHTVEKGEGFHWLSRESLLLTNNLLLFVAMGTVLLGTLYPLLMDALGLGKISVGPPYFDTVFVPLMTPLVFLMGVGPVARWKRASLPDLAARLRWALAVGVATAVVLPFVMGHWTPLISLGLLLAGWLFASLVIDLRRRIARVPLLQGLLGLPRAYYGMWLAHFGIALFVASVTITGGFSADKQVSMAPGQSAVVVGYRFAFKGAVPVPGPNYRATQATVVVTRGGEPVAVLHPQKRRYNVGGRVMTEAAIDGGLFRHLYVAMGNPAGDGGAWSMRLYYKPMVGGLWFSVLCMVLGGLLALSDRRYRLLAERTRARAQQLGDDGLAAETGR
ncbi:MAG TPA: heme lyase CcmF/NrfE family subunit [Gammaproteobacteria bacterium]|nr:heme lyase CcmF/NrfE family subunit [Gammaproteobacteria bacterium]